MATLLVTHSLVGICGLFHGWAVLRKVPFRYYYLDLALDIKNATAPWLVDKCVIAGSRATETLNYSFPCFITHCNWNYLPISSFHCGRNWCLLMQWLVRAHFYWQLERSLCLGNQIIIAAGFSISSAEKWVRDQNAQHVIKLEEGIPLFQSCSQALKDGHCWGLLSSSLLFLICVTLDKAHLCTLQFLPLWNHRIGLDYQWVHFWKAARGLIDKVVEISCYGKLLPGWGDGRQRRGGRQPCGFWFPLLASSRLAEEGERERENRKLCLLYKQLITLSISTSLLCNEIGISLFRDMQM